MTEVTKAPDAFLDLSAALTGFSRVDLESTGLADCYWAWLSSEHEPDMEHDQTDVGTGQAVADGLIALWEKVTRKVDRESIDARINRETAKLQGWPGPTWHHDAAVQQLVGKIILEDSKLGQAARNLIKLWYLGQWDGTDYNFGFWHPKVVSADAYKEGLVWTAIGAHPQAAKQEGFGTWSLPPRSLREANHSSAEGNS